MASDQTQSVVRATASGDVCYVQASLTPDENARLEAVCDAEGFKKGAFIVRAILDRLSQFERPASKRKST